VVLVGLVLAAPAGAGPPSKEAVAAWNTYAAATERRIDAELASGNPFLVEDIVAPGKGTRARGASAGDEIFVYKMPIPPGGGSTSHPDDALIHHWLGSVFVPGVRVADVLAFVQDYDHHAGKFPDAVGSKLLSRDGDHYKAYLKLRRTKVITVYYNTEHSVAYRVYGPDRASSRSIGTKIAELTDVGTSHEREKAPDDEHGFMWRLNSYWRFFGVPGGVVVECESISMSRDIPMLLRPIVAPFVNSIPRESLEQTLVGIRNGTIAMKNGARPAATSAR
jgi:uncharacterized protein (DUF1330 family)